MQDTDEDADHDDTERVSRHWHISWNLLQSHSWPTTEHRTPNFHGAAENQRLDFETNFFPDPKFFELEIFFASQSGVLGSGRVIDNSLFGVRCLD